MTSMLLDHDKVTGNMYVSRELCFISMLI